MPPRKLFRGAALIVLPRCEHAPPPRGAAHSERSPKPSASRTTFSYTPGRPCGRPRPLRRVRPRDAAPSRSCFAYLERRLSSDRDLERSAWAESNRRRASDQVAEISPATRLGHDQSYLELSCRVYDVDDEGRRRALRCSGQAALVASSTATARARDVVRKRATRSPEP